MEGSRIRELSPNHFRFGSGISAFTAKLKEQDAVGSEFLTSFHSLLPPQPQHTAATAAVHTAMGLFSHHPSHGKAPFSIDALLGLTTDTVRDNGSGHTHGPLLLNFRTHQKPFPDEASKSKLSVRYAPYKRERKPHQHQQQQQEESKDVHSGRSGKAKRVRTIFTPEQLEKLESEFERQQYMVGTERSYLAESLDLTEAQVKVWFQNRRIKWRKVHLEMQQERLRALRSQEGPEFESSSDSSPSMDPCHRPTPSDPPSSDDRRGGSLGGVTLSLPQPTLPNRWDASTNFHMDAYLLKTLGSRGDWTSGGHLTSEESGTESD